MNKIILLSLIIPALIMFPILLQNADAFKLTDYEIKLEVLFFNHNQTNTNSLINAIDNGLMEDIIFDVMEPIAVGQWAPDDITADNNLSHGFPQFHNVVLLNGSSATIVTNSKLVLDPVIIEINTAQGANKATVQDQIINNTQSQIRDMLQGHGINEYIWTLGYDQGEITVAETP